MKYYPQLAQFPVFTLNDARKVMGSAINAPKMLNLMIKEGSVRRIRQNLYTCFDYVGFSDTASRFDIASKITDSSFVAFHSAFEFYGCYNQVYYEVQVASQSRFTNFDDAGYSYRFLPTKSQCQVETIRGIKVSSMERTIVDSINMVSQVIGTEELVKCIETVNFIKEEKLTEVLLDYNKDILYRKVGYVLSFFKDEFRLSESFFEFCKEHSNVKNIGMFNSQESHETKFIREWGLYAFRNLRAITDKTGLASLN